MQQQTATPTATQNPIVAALARLSELVQREALALRASDPSLQSVSFTAREHNETETLEDLLVYPDIIGAFEDVFINDVSGSEELLLGTDAPVMEQVKTDAENGCRISMVLLNMGGYKLHYVRDEIATRLTVILPSS